MRRRAVCRFCVERRKRLQHDREQQVVQRHVPVLAPCAAPQRIRRRRAGTYARPLVGSGRAGSVDGANAGRTEREPGRLSRPRSSAPGMAPQEQPAVRVRIQLRHGCGGAGRVARNSARAIACSSSTIESPPATKWSYARREVERRAASTTKNRNGSIAPSAAKRSFSWRSISSVEHAPWIGTTGITRAIDMRVAAAILVAPRARCRA